MQVGQYRIEMQVERQDTGKWQFVRLCEESINMYVGYNIRYYNLTTIAIMGHLNGIYSD